MRNSTIKLILGTVGLILFLSLLYYFFVSSDSGTKNKKFVVVIPSYNNAQWYKKNLDSVFSQDFDNYRVVYIDDASTDQTGKLVKDYIKEKGQERRVKLIQNDKPEGTLGNIYKAISQSDPKEIAVILEGENWLSQPRALSILNEAYSNPNLWLTYGQFVYSNGTPGFATKVPDNIIEQNDIRKFRGAGTTSLRTFYTGLFQKIKKKDLLVNNEFYPAAWDLAMMFPMIEMAGKHSRYIPEVFYIFNIEKVNNDDPLGIKQLDDYIREQEPYHPINSL